MATVLQTIVEKKHYKFIDQPVTWEEAVRLSALSLVEDGSVDADYYEQIVACIKKYGPYIVMVDGVAMPHSSEGATGVHKTGIGFMVSKQDVDFGKDEDGEQKTAKLFFTLAACNPEEHMNNIAQLAAIFNNDDLLAALMEAETPEDILAAEEKYPCEDDF